MLCVTQLKCYMLGSVINADAACSDAAFANVSTAVECRIYIYGTVSDKMALRIYIYNVIKMLLF